jgi:hypothetical protein
MAVTFRSDRHFVILSLLSFEEIRDKEPDIRGTFCKATHKVGIPMSAKGNIHAHRIAAIK